MSIFSIVIAISYAALISIQRQSRDTTARADAVSESRLGIAQMDRQIRSGNVLFDPANESALGYPMSMRIYTQANAENKCVQWQLKDGALRMRSWSPDWPAPGSTKSAWSTIARDIVNDPAKPADTPFTLAGATGPYSARVVSVHLMVKPSKASGHPVDVKTSLTGRNTVYGYDQNICSPIPTG
jgi:hypothetical protein